jgi:hypothetical protein
LINDLAYAPCVADVALIPASSMSTGSHGSLRDLTTWCTDSGRLGDGAGQLAGSR